MSTSQQGLFFKTDESVWRSLTTVEEYTASVSRTSTTTVEKSKVKARLANEVRIKHLSRCYTNTISLDNSANGGKCLVGNCASETLDSIWALVSSPSIAPLGPAHASPAKHEEDVYQFSVGLGELKCGEKSEWAASTLMIAVQSMRMRTSPQMYWPGSHALLNFRRALFSLGKQSAACEGRLSATACRREAVAGQR